MSAGYNLPDDWSWRAFNSYFDEGPPDEKDEEPARPRLECGECGRWIEDGFLCAGCLARKEER